MRDVLLALVVVLLTTVLYVKGLGSPFAYLSIEEVSQANTELMFSKTGRSVTGEKLPLYFSEPGGGEFGRDPIWVYASAALLKYAPFSEAIVRIPSALAGIVDVWLMFLLGRRVFASNAVGLVGATLLALTPAHFFHSRLATAQIGPVPFVLTWLLFCVRYFDTNRSREIFLATACLGLGVYSYLAAAVTFPLYFAATLVSMAIHHRWKPPVGDFWLALAGFAIALVPWMLWHVAHFEWFQQVATYYTHNGYNQDLNLRNPAAMVISRTNIWWNAFSPERLFLTGDNSLRFSTRWVGYFLLPTVVFIVAGMAELGGAFRPELRFLIVTGLLLGPLPAILVADYEIKRWLTILPCVTLTAIAGLRCLLSSKRRIVQATAIGLLLLCLAQFTSFVRDYSGDYRARSSFYFGGNFRGAIRETLTTARDPACVFLDGRLAIESYWRLYTRAYGRAEFAEHTTLVDSDQFAPAPTCQEAAFIVPDQQVQLAQRLRSPGWTRTAIPEFDGKIYLAVYRHFSSAVRQ